MFHFILALILMFINWSESQTFGKIEYGLRFDNQFDALINSSYICPINLYSKFNL